VVPAGIVINCHVFFRAFNWFSDVTNVTADGRRLLVSVHQPMACRLDGFHFWLPAAPAGFIPEQDKVIWFSMHNFRTVPSIAL
jgi:hypothetical protein